MQIRGCFGSGHLARFCATLSFVVFAGCNSSASPPAISACDVFKDPASFEGKSVVISGQVKSDALHFTLLIDPRCKERGISLTTPPALYRKAGIKQLRDAIYGDRPIGTSGKLITADISGAFHQDGANPPHYELVIDGVSNFVVKKIGP